MPPRAVGMKNPPGAVDACMRIGSEVAISAAAGGFCHGNRQRDSGRRGRVFA